VRVLIIGGTGLISTAITRTLLERGEDVTLYNRGRTRVRFDGEVEQIHGDRKDRAAFEAQVREAAPFDCVIDMICFVPEDAESLITAFGGRVAQVIFCSTVDVYNNPASRYPYTEDEARDRTLGSYGQNKVKCEDAFFAAHERGEFGVTVIRPAMTYGEGGSLVHTMGWDTGVIDRIRRGRPVICHGDGTSLWVACHVDDAAAAFANAIGNEAATGRAYHVTGEEWMTWNGYYRGIAEALGAPDVQLVHIPTDLLVKVAPRRAGVCGVNFQFNNIFDNSAAHRDLGFAYTIPWVEGVRRTVAWLDEHGRIADSDDDPAYDRVIDAWRELVDSMGQALAGLDL
jgi:nucleoside-diphosphate-sugar epimerase